MAEKNKKEVTVRSSAAEYLTYVASVGDSADSIEMRYEDENIWLTQKMLAALYDVDVRTINYHLKKIFEDAELQEDAVIRIFRITAAKNYLTADEMASLELIVSAYLDLAENRTRRKIPMTMEDWAKRIDKFIDLFESPILQDSGKVSAEYAKDFAESEFEKYRIIQDRLFQSDFDRFEDNSLPALDIE